MEDFWFQQVLIKALNYGMVKINLYFILFPSPRMMHILNFHKIGYTGAFVTNFRGHV